MRCPQCGNEVEQGIASCPTCGRPLGDLWASQTTQLTQQLPAAETMQMPAAAPAPGAAPQAAYAQPAAAPATPAKKKPVAVIIIVAVVAALLLCCCATGVGGWFFYRSQQDKPTATEVEDRDDADAGGTDDASPSAEPRATVEAFYTALDAGDFEALKASFTSAAGEDLSPGDFEGITTVDYEVTGQDRSGDTAIVFVTEFDGGLFGGGYELRFDLAAEDGEWRIAGWQETAPGDTGSGGGADADTGAGSTPIDATMARGAVETMLLALEEDRVSDAKNVATGRFLAADPGFFSATSGTFLDFLMAGEEQQGGKWLVHVEEQWKSGPEITTYTVILDGGEPKVDSVQYK